MPSINSRLYYLFLYNFYIYFKNLNHIFVLNITKNEKQVFLFLQIIHCLECSFSGSWKSFVYKPKHIASGLQCLKSVCLWQRAGVLSTSRVPSGSDFCLPPRLTLLVPNIDYDYCYCFWSQNPVHLLFVFCFC